MPFGDSQAIEVPASLLVHRGWEGREQGMCIIANYVRPTGETRSKADEAELTIKGAWFGLIG